MSAARAEREQGPILFIAPVEPWCRENGSSVIIADLLEGLYATSGADVFPVFLRRPPPGCREKLPCGPRGIQLGLEGVPRWVSVMKAVALRSSPIRLRFDIPRATQRILDVVHESQVRPALVHVEHLPLVDMGASIARHFGAPLVYRSHNVEAQLLERRLGVSGPIARAVTRHMARAEAAASELCDLTLCISDGDAAWLRSHTRTARVDTLPCSLLLDRYEMLPPDRRSVQPQIAFVGGLDWAPNDSGLKWFVENVFAQVVSQIPEARLAVLARGASTRPWLTRNANVEVLSDTLEARELFASSWLSIAPLLQGGGVRIKIPESLAVGCPVVSTSIGAEGHDLPGLTRADEPAKFAAACVARLTELSTAAESQEFRRAVNARYGATVLAASLRSTWTELIERRRASLP